MYSIGELSRISGLTVRALRLYHERGILVPSAVNQTTHYRYYDGAALERARAISALRSMMVSLEDIQALLTESPMAEDAIDILQRHRDRIDVKARDLAAARRRIACWIDQERRERALIESSPVGLREVELSPLYVASIRFAGKYADCGHAFGRLARAVRGAANGPALALFYDDEVTEGDATIECCFPIEKRVAAAGVVCCELPGGRAVALVHRGPYETVGRSYAKAFDEIRARAVSVIGPSRETYLKGPGMILRGNPARYVTDLQFLVST
jgi:DNA-binding transcriptional MerR regulator/effector-binding domain-containing protein